MIPRLKDHYDKVIVVNLQNKFSMKNKLMVPKILKFLIKYNISKKSFKNIFGSMPGGRKTWPIG